MPDIDIDAGRLQTLTTMINAENLPNQTHYREVLSQIVSPNSASLCAPLLNGTGCVAL